VVTSSLTKRPVAADELQALAARAFGPRRRVASWTELTRGTVEFYQRAAAVGVTVPSVLV